MRISTICFAKVAFLIFAFVLCGSLSANAQYFADKSRQLDSLWNVVNAIENEYRLRATTYSTKASQTGRRVRVKAYDAGNAPVFREKTRHFASGMKRRRFMAYNTTLRIKLETFVLKTYGDNIAFASGVDNAKKKRIKIVNNRIF